MAPPKRPTEKPTNKVLAKWIFLFVSGYLLFAWLSGGWPFERDEWIGFFYPAGFDSGGPDNAGKVERSGYYLTLEACRAAMLEKGAEAGGAGGEETADYLCGLNCEARLDISTPDDCTRQER